MTYLENGSKVKGLYYGIEYSGVVSNSRLYFGNDRELMNYLIYYIKLDTPMKDGNRTYEKIMVHEINKKNTIELFA